MTIVEVNETNSLVRHPHEFVEVKLFFAAPIGDVIYLADAPIGPEPDRVAAQARAFESRLSDDSTDEPADFRTPDDDFGS